MVKSDGAVLDMMRSLRKDNTGYHLTKLFVGAEGTLGVITGATIQLYPQPAVREWKLLAVYHHLDFILYYLINIVL